MITFICEICKASFSVYPADVRKGGGKCCSVVCRNRRLALLNIRDFNERFWDKVDKNGPVHPIHGQCWNWTGGKTQDGYGMLKKDCKSVSSIRCNRLSWEIHFGPIPNNLLVLHKCDNPSCVNPSHLFLGTDMDNYRDSRKKDRHVYGERNGTAKLTEAEVLSIKKEYVRWSMGYRKLAEKYHVSKGAIQSIMEGKSWMHLS